MVKKYDLNLGILFVKNRSDCDDKITEKKQFFRKVLIDTNITSKNINKEDSVLCEKTQLQTKLCYWCDDLKLDVLFTVGGVEWSPLDIVPEVTKSIINRQALSLTVALIKQSLDQPPSSRGLLTRGFCGIRGSTLIINLSDDDRQIKTSLEFLSPLLGDIVTSLRRETTLSVTDLLAEDLGRLEESEINQTSYDSDDGLLPVTFTDHTKEKQCIFDASSKEDKTEDHNILGEITANESEQTPVLNAEINKLNTKSSKRLYSGTDVNSETSAKRLKEFPIIDNQNFRTDKSQDFDIPVPEVVTKFIAGTEEACPIESDDSHSGSERLKTIDMTALRKHSIDSKKQESHILGSRYHFSTLRRASKPSAKCDGTKYSKRKTRKFGEINKFSDSNIRSSQDEQASSEDNGAESMTVNQGTTTHEDVYHFDSQSDSEGEEILSRVTKTPKKPKKSFKEARIYHNCDANKEVTFVPVGEGMTNFLKTHPSIRGIYLNKGKRHVKKTLVTLKRQETAVDKGSWERKGHRLERNRFDDYFEVTEAGAKKKEEIGRCQSRDEYVVNWYVWCPGHGNCYRKCGGYGECLQGCSGMAHKQDRHNCSFLVNCKIFLSDLTKWRIQLTGCHVPVDSSIQWSPPAVDKQRMNQDTRDFILSQFQAKNISTATVQEAYLKGQNSQSAVLTKRKISRVMWGLKKRKSEKQKSKSACPSAANSKMAGTSEPVESFTVITIPSTTVTGQCIHVSQSSSLPNITFPVQSHSAVDLSLGVNAMSSTAVDLSSSINFTHNMNMAVDLSSRPKLSENNMTLLDPSSSLVAVDQSQGLSAVVNSSSLTDVNQSQTLIDVNQSSSLASVDNLQRLIPAVDQSQKLTDVDQSQSFAAVNQSHSMKAIDQSSTLTNVQLSQQLADVDQSQHLANVDQQQAHTVIDQSSSLTTVDKSVQQNQAGQPKVIIIHRDSRSDPSNIDVAELIQNSEIGDGDMSNSDLRAVLLSLYQQQ